MGYVIFQHSNYKLANLMWGRYHQWVCSTPHLFVPPPETEDTTHKCTFFRCQWQPLLSASQVSIPNSLNQHKSFLCVSLLLFLGPESNIFVHKSKQTTTPWAIWEFLDLWLLPCMSQTLVKSGKILVTSFHFRHRWNFFGGERFHKEYFRKE